MSFPVLPCPAIFNNNPAPLNPENVSAPWRRANMLCGKQKDRKEREKRKI
jgi:hypothetical protein